MIVIPRAVVLPPGVTKAIWLRCPTSSGSKDWLCAQHSPSGVTTWWGKTWHVNQSNFNQRGRLDNIVPVKTGKGYVEVASWTPQTGWLEPGQAQSAPPEPPEPSVSVDPPEPKTTKKPKRLTELEASIDAPEWF